MVELSGNGKLQQYTIHMDLNIVTTTTEMERNKRHSIHIQNSTPGGDYGCYSFDDFQTIHIFKGDNTNIYR